MIDINTSPSTQLSHDEADEIAKMSQLSDSAASDLADEIADKGAIAAEHSTRKLDDDEVWKLHAVAHYEGVPKHPVTNFLHRDDASKILGMLNKMSDKAIVDEYKGLCNDGGSLSAGTRAGAFHRLLQILVKRRELSRYL